METSRRQIVASVSVRISGSNSGLNARYHLAHEWGLLLEGRYFAARRSGITETGVLATAYRQFGPNMMLGLGYNFGNVSEDLTDLAIDDQGVF